MTFMQFVIMLALALDALWAGIKMDYPVPDKPMVQEWQAVVEGGFAEIGLENNNKDVPVFIFAPGSNWMGATQGMWRKGCLRTYALNTALLNKTSLYYATPEWMAVDAHEVAHVYQAVRCANDIRMVESSAEIITWSGLSYLAEHGNRDAYASLVYDLRRAAILASLDGGAWGILEQLQLSEKERDYFESISPYYLHDKGDLYWTRALASIYGEMYGDDGKYSLDEGWLYWGELDARSLHEFIDGLVRIDNEDSRLRQNQE